MADRRRQTGEIRKNDGLGGFFFLTFVIMLLTWGIMALFQIRGMTTTPDNPVPSPFVLLLFLLGGFSPSIAGIIQSRRVDGRSGPRNMLRRSLRFSLGLKWYAAIILIPVATGTLRIVLHVLNGREFLQSQLIANPLTLIGFTIQIFLFGPLSEEFGWRGFALDRLLTRFGTLNASLILGLFWAFWHLPLFFIPGSSQSLYGNPIPEFAVFAVGVIGLTIILTWIYLGTNRNLWAAILFHAAYNYVLSFLVTVMDDGLSGRLLTSAVLILLSVFIVLSWKPAPGISPERA